MVYVYIYIYIYIYLCIYIPVYIYTHTHTQVHLKGFKYNEKVQYLLSLISESKTHILYRFIKHRVKHFKPLFLKNVMIMAYI